MCSYLGGGWRQVHVCGQDTFRVMRGVGDYAHRLGED